LTERVGGVATCFWRPLLPGRRIQFGCSVHGDQGQCHPPPCYTITLLTAIQGVPRKLKPTYWFNMLHSGWTVRCCVAPSYPVPDSAPTERNIEVVQALYLVECWNGLQVVSSGNYTTSARPHSRLKWKWLTTLTSHLISISF